MRLLVVEDEPQLGVLLRRALEHAGFAVDLATGLAGARDCLRVATHDLAIIDRGLGDGDGLDLLSGLRAAANPLPVLLLTARDAPEDRVGGLDAGADDYVVKPFHLDELISRVRALLRRPSAALGTELRMGGLALNTITRQASIDGATLTLSARETALLEILLRRQGNVVTREAIERSLYALDQPTTPNAVEVLVHRLRRRLQDAGAGAMIHTIRGVGYLLGPE